MILLTNKTTESSICELLSVTEEMKPQVREALNSDALRPDVQLLGQRLVRKRGEQLTDLSESQAAERVAIAVLSLFPDAEAARPCLKGLRKFFADGLKLMPSQVARVIGSARLKAFCALPAGDRDIIQALPYRVAYECSLLTPEEQQELISQHFNRQRSEGGKPNTISKREVVAFKATRSITPGQPIAQPSDEAKQASSNSLTVEQLKEAAPDIKGALFAEMLRLKIEKAFKQDPTPQLANQIQDFAGMLARIAQEIEDRLQDFG